MILNIYPDHLERHGSFLKYIKAKFKLIKNQNSNDYAYLNLKNKYLKKIIKKEKISAKLINVRFNNLRKIKKKIRNIYFNTSGNKENLSFILAIAKNLKLEKNKII